MTPFETLATKPYDLNVIFDELDNLHPLAYAAKYGVIDYIKTTLSGLDSGELGLIINQSNSNGLTALHFACRYGQVESVKLLIFYRALSNPTKSSGQFPIHMIFNDKNDLEHCEALFLLLKEQGVEVKTSSSESIAHFAAAKNSVNILKIINDENPNLINCKDNLSMTPLLTAVVNNQIDAVIYLIKICNINIKNSKQQNALHIAAKSSNVKMLELLLPYFAINLPDGEGNSALDIVRSTKQHDKESLINKWIDSDPNCFARCPS